MVNGMTKPQTSKCFTRIATIVNPPNPRTGEKYNMCPQVAWPDSRVTNMSSITKVDTELDFDL